ncbi:Qat anti-phage system associated protein QatB [Persicitalea jodogahamensis]|uniref:Uncharacterized protein n=1 Tax=Persicitalea jodogahamensis TaxID=402147 RepID=A0A8J3DDA8_9BACT|nr:Qat anti-phage system associated protein QatB [Persicitalea jodogahamensis]GHB86376.1 hypothetical protein GCM10007390_47360 [Persicitalea jodogahamensis]
MGTSNSYGGPGNSTPLVPSWLNDEYDSGTVQDSPENESDESDSTAANGDDNTTDTDSGLGDSKPSAEPDDAINTERYRQARTNFTRFVKSGGSGSAALGRAVSNYVSKSSGGSRKAAQKMGASKRTTSGIVNFLGSVRTEGIQSTLEKYNLGHLIGRSIEDIFLGLSDYICPDGGNIDEGIARSAFIETIVDLAEQGITDLSSLSDAQFQLIVEMYATNAIEARLCNDIGTKIIIAPENLSSVENIQEQLHDFISRGVSDAVNSLPIEFKDLTMSDTTNFVEQIYIEAFNILKILGEIESNSK